MGFFQFVYFLFQGSEQATSVPEYKAKIGNGNGSKSVTDDFQKKIHLLESFVYILESFVYILESFVNRFKPSVHIVTHFLETYVGGLHEGFQSCLQTNKPFSVCLCETGAGIGVSSVSSKTEMRQQEKNKQEKKGRGMKDKG